MLLWKPGSGIPAQTLGIIWDLDFDLHVNTTMLKSLKSADLMGSLSNPPVEEDEVAC